jgi:uncharacterized protein YkwD
MTKIAALGSLALMLVVAGCAGTLATTEEATTLNGFRAAHGRSTLHSDSNLESLARGHAQNMARREAMDHSGFMTERGPAGARAENVAYGCNDSPCVIRQWVNSSGHRANMLLPDIGAYGLASAVSKSGRHYWALELGQ